MESGIVKLVSGEYAQCNIEISDGYKYSFF